jgi:hypothetical protein
MPAASPLLPELSVAGAWGDGGRGRGGAGGEGRWGAAGDEEVARCAAELGLEASAGLVARVQLLLAAMATSPSVTLLGPAAAGKSCVVQTAAGAARLGGAAVSVRAVNPKALSPRELWGFRPPGGRWRDGVLAAVLRDTGSAPRPPPAGPDSPGGGKGVDDGDMFMAMVSPRADGAPAEAEGGAEREEGWVVLDGPVDPVWGEALMPLMAAGGRLVLASGESVQLHANARLVFETDSLAHASPAWASASAPVCVWPSDAGRAAHVAVWLRQRDRDGAPAAATAALRRLMGGGPGDVLGDVLGFVRAECKYAVAATEAALVCGVTALLSSVPALSVGRRPDAAESRPLSRASSGARSDAGSDPPLTPAIEPEPAAGGGWREAEEDEDGGLGVVAGMSFVFAVAWGIGT